MEEVPKSPETAPAEAAPPLPPPIYELPITPELMATVEVEDKPETDFDKRNEKLREDADHTSDPAGAGMVALSEVLKQRAEDAPKPQPKAKASKRAPKSPPPSPVISRPVPLKRFIILGMVGGLLIAGSLIYLLTRP